MRIILKWVALALGLPHPLAGQTLGLSASAGIWRHDTLAVITSAGYVSPLWSPLDYGIALTHVNDHRSLFDRTQTGGEFSLGLGRDGSGFYVLGAAGLAMRHEDGNIDASWSAGGGVSARPLPFVSVGIETRYRVEDQFTHGFWQLDPADRRGWMALGQVSLVLGGGGRSRSEGRSPAAPSRPAFGRDRSAERRGTASGQLAARVVATAVEAMGTPYRWGGDGSNGYDCSGLIQFAYSEHGISIPRISRDQAVFGSSVKRQVEDLAPGDILGFRGDGERVSHVGLYLGAGQFIHSASSGVKISSLVADDPDSQWWQARWSAARRVLD